VLVTQVESARHRRTTNVANGAPCSQFISACQRFRAPPRVINNRCRQEALRRTRCLAFAGGPAATPALQQSEVSRQLTVCVVYGSDVVPRLGVATVIQLMDELNAHGVLSIARRKLREHRAPEPEPEPEPGGVNGGEAAVPQLALAGRVLWIDPKCLPRGMSTTCRTIWID
jgi:hypothetical protein